MLIGFCGSSKENQIPMSTSMLQGKLAQPKTFVFGGERETLPGTYDSLQTPYFQNICYFVWLMSFAYKSAKCLFEFGHVNAEVANLRQVMHLLDE